MPRRITQRRIALVPIEEPPPAVAFSRDSGAARLAAPAQTLRYRLTATDARSLEALRYARRAMLREEWTLGVEPGEASLGDAIFSTTEIEWPITLDQRERCEAKLVELTERANRALEELPAGVS